MHVRGAGGSANKRSGGGAGGGGGEVLLSNFKLSNIKDGILKFKIGNIGTQTQLYNTNPTLLYVANAGKKGGNGSSKKGDGGDSYNGLAKRTIDAYTSGLGSGVGGAGGSYTANGSNGSTANLANGVVGAKTGNSIRDPFYITINLNDGTENINTSYGGRGNQGQEDGYDAEPGYVLIYYNVYNNIQYFNYIDLGSNNTVTFGYNPVGKYLPVNYTNTIQDWCYIYLKDSTVPIDTNIINNLIGNKPYNILAVGGGGGGGNYFYDNSDPGNRSDFSGGGGGAGGECVHKININPNDIITQITVGNRGNSNRDTNINYKVISGENTTINYNNTTNNILSRGGPGAYDCENHKLFNSNSRYNYYTSKGMFEFNDIFCPAGGASRGQIGLEGSNKLFKNTIEWDLISPNDIESVMTKPNKLYNMNNTLHPITTIDKNTIYEIYKGDIMYYGSKTTNLKTSFSYKNVVNNDITLQTPFYLNKIPNINDITVQYIGALGRGYHQDKSPDGLMTRTEVNSNFDSTASPYRNGNIITYNFNNKIFFHIIA